MKRLAILLVLLPFAATAQKDVFGSATVALGLKYKSTSYSGFYLRTDDRGSGQAAIYATDKIVSIKDNGAAINMDGQYYIFRKKSFEIYNLDGLLYLLSYFGNMGSNHNGELYYSLANMVTTPSRKLEAVPSPVDFKKAARFFNFNGIDIKGEFGKKQLNFGVNMVFKVIGVRGAFTWFEDKNYQYVYHNMTRVHTIKTLLGPNVAYRRNFKKFSLASVAGVNFCANRRDFRINTDSYVNAVCFIGKKAGMTVGFKYELINGSTKESYDVGGTANQKVMVSQVEFGLGAFF